MTRQLWGRGPWKDAQWELVDDNGEGADEAFLLGEYRLAFRDWEWEWR